MAVFSWPQNTLNFSGDSENWGVSSWGPYMRNHVLGSILGAPDFGRLIYTILAEILWLWYFRSCRISIINSRIGSKTNGRIIGPRDCMNTTRIPDSGFRARDNRTGLLMITGIMVLVLLRYL